MCSYPHNRPKSPDIPEPTIAETFMLELLEEELLGNGKVSASDPHDYSSEFDPNVSDMYAGPDNDSEGYKSKTIQESLYVKSSPDDVARSCTHLSLDQQNDLADVLHKHECLFDGELCSFQGAPIHLDIDPSVPACQTRPYDVPHCHHAMYSRKNLITSSKLEFLKKLVTLNGFPVHLLSLRKTVVSAGLAIFARSTRR